MKLASLLAQYLYLHKRLDLPGLGTFQLDPAAPTEPDNNRQSKSLVLEGVSFENNPALKESPELIAFISAQTGKIKALAAADLDSHLGLALQFINIGKPFLFEGIGSLSKTRSSEFMFTPGQVLTEKFAGTAAKEPGDITALTETPLDYKEVFYASRTKIKWAKPVTILLIIAGLVLAVWGGYTVYKKTAAREDIAGNDTENNSTAANATSDSIRIEKTETTGILPDPVPAGAVKFVLETADAKRAIPRFNKLRTFQWDVKMETSDSLSFKIFMLLPVTASDTSRVLDSLSRLNGRKVYIEN